MINKFCIHCGTPRVPISSERIEIIPPTQSMGTPQDVIEPAPKKKITSQALFKKKWFIALLIIVPVLCCGLVVGAIVWATSQTGSDNILLGVPTGDDRSDLYLLRLEEEVSKGTLLAEDVYSYDMEFNYNRDGETYSLGNYDQNFGGFIPEQELLVIWYEDEDGDFYLQRQELNRIPRLQSLTTTSMALARFLNNGQDIFINEDFRK